MASDLERLIVTIEANTKQFERAMRSLDKSVDQGMRSVERSAESSLRRQEAMFGQFGRRMGQKFDENFRRGLGAFLTLNFIKDALKSQAEQGDLQAQHALDTLDQFWKDAYGATVKGGEKVAKALNDAANKLIPLTYKPIEQVSGGVTNKTITDRIIGDTTAASSDFQVFLNTSTQQIEQYVNKISKLGQTPAGPTRSLLQNLTGATDTKTGSLGAQQLQFIVNLQDELKMLGMTNDEQAVYNNLKAAGALQDKVAAGYITEVTLAYREQQRQLEALKDANQALEDSSKTFVQGLLQGESAADALNEALRRLADALLDMAFKSLFNPGGTPLLQTLLGGFLGGSSGGPLKLPGSPGSTASVSNASLGSSARSGGMTVQHVTSINVQGSVDQKTLAAMSGMIQRNNTRQNAELQRNWGAHQARYSSLRGP